VSRGGKLAGVEASRLHRCAQSSAAIDQDWVREMENDLVAYGRQSDYLFARGVLWDKTARREGRSQRAAKFHRYEDHLHGERQGAEAFLRASCLGRR
jgi:hypothetical protein